MKELARSSQNPQRGRNGTGQYRNREYPTPGMEWLRSDTGNTISELNKTYLPGWLVIYLFLPYWPLRE